MSKLHVHVQVPQLALSAESWDGDIVTGGEVAGVGRRSIHAQIFLTKSVVSIFQPIQATLDFAKGCIFKHFKGSLTKALNDNENTTEPKQNKTYS